MKTESPPSQQYPQEKDANFALFHFTGNVYSIEKFVVKGINQYSAEEIEDLRQTEMEQAVKILKTPWFTSKFSKKTDSQKIKEPDKALCCSLAISSSDPKDQLKIKFYDTYSFMKGVGIVIEDPKKVLVPHADYFAFNSGGILPPNLVKNDFLTSSTEGTNIDLRSIYNSLNKPVRGAFYSATLPSFSVTNYASYSHEDKGVLENRGGEKGFFNFARNFYRTSLHGKSTHDKPKWNKKSKYYPLDSSTQKRPEANYTELLVYQKKGEDNPVNGVVLNMDVLRFGNGDVEKLKALFEKNQNLALYIYDSSLEKDFIRKVEGIDAIKVHLDLIKSKMSESGSCFELGLNRSEVKKANSELQVFRNQILKDSSAGLAVDDGAPASAPAPAPAPKEKITEKFSGFYNLLDREQVIEFLKFLWGGGQNNNDYDVLKIELANVLKETYTGDDSEKNRKALQLINEVNRERAIAKLMELNQEAKKQETEDFIATYRQIYSQHKLDIFLEQDEFDLGKQEMLFFVTSKQKSERLNKIDELQKLFKDDGHQVKDIEILSFFNSLQPDSYSPTSVQTQSLRKIWDEHEQIMKKRKTSDVWNGGDDYTDNLKAVARRDFLLLAIEAMEDRANKTSLEEYIKIKYKEAEFLANFASEVKSMLNAEISKNPPAPPPESNQEKRNRQCNEFLNWMDYFQNGDGKPYLKGGALIGGVGGGLIGGGLCVSALGVGAILSAPIIIPVAVGVGVGVAVGAVGGLVVGTIVKNPNANKFQNKDGSKV